jgi:hypothetical protein
LEGGREGGKGRRGGRMSGGIDEVVGMRKRKTRNEAIGTFKGSKK